MGWGLGGEGIGEMASSALDHRVLDRISVCVYK